MRLSSAITALLFTGCAAKARTAPPSQPRTTAPQRVIGCNHETRDTSVRVHEDRVSEAYKHTAGPEDLEERLNEDYEGEEIISISVHDEVPRQLVTLFFDRNKSGQLDECEAIFAISLVMDGDGDGRFDTQGLGPFRDNHTTWVITAGMLLGDMLSAVRDPSYVPRYSQPYITSATRIRALVKDRASYRAANPNRQR